MRLEVTLLLAVSALVPLLSACGGDDEPAGTTADASVSDASPADATTDTDASVGPDADAASQDASDDVIQDSGLDADQPDAQDAGKPDADPADAATPDADAACTETPFDMETWPVRLMLLLDQSSSMDSSWELIPSKWNEVRDGLEHFFAQPAAGRFDYGLDAFPDGSLAYLEQCGSLECCPMSCPTSAACLNLMTTCSRGCAVDLPPIVPMAPAATAGPQILDYMAHDYLPAKFSNTPLLGQLQWYRDEGPTEIPTFFDKSAGSSALVVISDGADSCEGDTSDPAVVAQVIADLGSVTADLYADHSIRTLAIGFGDTSGDMADELNAIASHGGTQLTSFLPIDDTGALEDALGSVIEETSSCVVTFDASAVTDPQLVNVYLDGDALAYDDTCTDGWHWVDGTHQQVELCGNACSDLNDGTATTVSGTTGCPTM